MAAAKRLKISSDPISLLKVVSLAKKLMNSVTGVQLVGKHAMERSR